MHNIASERVRKGYTQEATAEYLKVNVRTYRNWEKNPLAVSGSYLNQLADLFDCSVDYLLGLTDKRK